MKMGQIPGVFVYLVVVSLGGEEYFHFWFVFLFVTPLEIIEKL